MNGNSSGDDSLPLTVVREIDRIADRFEAEWQAGRHPRIEDYLAHVEEAVQSRLFQEVLRVELEYRRGQGEKPTAENYHSRFANHGAVIDEVFAGSLSLDTFKEQGDSAMNNGADMPSPTAHYTSRRIESDDGQAAGPTSRPPRIPGYEILAVLGQGGMGIVYKARQVELNRIVALKMIQSRRLRDLVSRSRFRAEARVVAQFDHPNIVRVHDCGEQDGRLYYALEFVPGGSLEQQQRRPRSPREAIELVAQLADAVEYAHRQGIVHRDLKPDNILLTVDGIPKITDFGLSKQLQDNLGNDTCPGAPLGTPAYMAPEQADGRLESIGPSTDIFGLGGILYYLLTGRPLFQGERLEAVLNLARRGQVPPLRQYNTQVPAALERICMKALAADPQERYVSAAALGKDLRRLLRQSRRLPLLAEILAGLLVVGLVAWLLSSGMGRVEPTLAEPSARIATAPPAETKHQPGDQKKDDNNQAIVNSIHMRLMRIPPGKFVMGSPPGEEGRDSEEQAHSVEITRPFAMGVYEVTQREFETVMGKNPSFFKDLVVGRDTQRFPVEEVSWDNARTFCLRLSELETKLTARKVVYRLPTEAEWEYACRGGSAEAMPVHFGQSLSSEEANFNGNRPFGGAPRKNPLNRPTEVGSFEPNRFGLYDMHGNVAEWCADWYDPDYYKKSPVQDPPGPPNSPIGMRVLRSGSWLSDGSECRAANRHHSFPHVKGREYGFRVVLEPDK